MLSNVFASPLEDNSLESVEWIPIEPDSFNAGTGTQRVELTHKAIDSFVNLHRSYLEVKLKVVDNAGNDTDANDEIALSNGISIFDRITLTANGAIVSETSNYQQSQQVLSLCEFSKDFRDNQAQNFNHNTDTNNGAADGNNLGYVSRRTFARNGATQNLHIPLSQMWGMTRDLDVVSRGIKYQMILHLNQNNLALHCAAGADGADKAPQIHYIKFKWWMCVVRPNLSEEARINQSLNAGMVQNLDWMEVSCFKSQAFQEANPRFRIASQIRDPKHAFVVCLPTATANGSYTSNAAVYSSNGITEMNLVVNNKLALPQPYETNFAANNVDLGRVKAALDRYKSPYMNTDGANLVNLVDYANIYPIFYFNLSDVKDESFTTEGACDMDVQIKCSAATQVNFFCVVLHKRSAVISGNSTQMTLQQL
jgi:hypothetical protein